MALIKSHSNYVLKKKHQTVSDGTIWERDITTIGRVNFFAPGQEPIFRDNNFIITVRNDNAVSNQYNRGGWKDGGNGDIWTLQTISAITSDYDDQNDTKIVLKQDYYDFCDFAYYGSLSELFRASITDIIARFPGELYGSTDHVYYTHVKVVDGERIEEEKMLGEDGYVYELKNPFGIDIYTQKLPVGKNPLKYFADDGFNEYEYIGEGKITGWSATTANTCAAPGTLIATIKISTASVAMAKTIRVYAGNNGTVHYMHKVLSGCHIRPKETPYIANFYNGCDNFQKLLMNRETTPKYKAVFSVIDEDDYGYHRELKTFIFPTSDGGYNIDATSYGFNAYTNEFARIGEFYDERFTDNLWRSMTHEAIKNFDWTRTREYEVGDEEEYVLGGEKMQKALRIFAREFDEIKTYIDNITSVNRVTYDDRANVPNYFLTDICENEGWDIVQVIPYDVTLNDCICDANTYVQRTKNEVKPYNTEIKGKDGTNLKNGYFISCCSGDGTSISDILCEYDGNTNYFVKVADENQTTFYDDCADKIRRRIKSFTDTGDTYTYMDANNEFLRRLKLNSRYIWRHKGTQEGIEMILAMFGLKSKRWFCAQENWKKENCYGDESCEDTSNWDYDITEYTRYTKALTEEWDSCHNMYKFDWVNSTKTITYDYRTTSAYNAKGAAGINYIPYQGLPVAYDDYNGTRKLYPKFNSNEQYDGNPYFQMNGGWLSKKVTDGSSTYGFQYDIDNVAVYEPNGDIYKETIRSIRRVENLHDLLAIPPSQVETNTICYVENLNNDMLIVDGEAFDISVDSSGNELIILRRSNGMIKVGDKYFDTNITVYGSDGNLHTYDLTDKLDGYPVNAYIVNNSFHCSNGAYSIDIYRFFRKTDSDTESNYFILNDESFSNTIAISSEQSGWERLKKSSYIYRKINTIWNYYKGNNPHAGNLKYDSGEEYYEYFKHIFKHAYENNLFDERCFNDYYNDIDDVYEKAVFSGISGDSADTKIHYFGNYKGKDNFYHIYGEKKHYQYPCTANTICGEYDENGSVKCDRWKCFYNTNNIKYYQIVSGNTETKPTNRVNIDGEIQPWNSTDSITNQIMNNKRLSITFNIGYNYHTEDGQAKLKFIDGVIMNYLTQLIPSTTIVDIKYEFNKPDGTSTEGGSSEETSTEGLPTEKQISDCCKYGCEEIVCENMIDMGLSVDWGQYPLGTDENYNTFSYYQWGYTDVWKTGEGGTSHLAYDGDVDSSRSDYPYDTDVNDMSSEEHDAIRANYSDTKYRMPKKEEAEELLSDANTTKAWQSNYNGKGVKGWLLTSKINGNQLFIPAVGEFYPENNTAGQPWEDHTKNGNTYIWTRSGKIIGANNEAGYRIYAGANGSDNIRVVDSSRRYGNIVMPVCDKNI